MARDPLIAALLGELETVVAGAQAARRIVTEIERSAAAAQRSAMVRGASRLPSPAPSIRYSGITVPEAASLLGIGEEQVRRLLRRGELVGVPFGGRRGWRLSRDYVISVAAKWDAQREGQAEARASDKPRKPRKGQRKRPVR